MQQEEDGQEPWVTCPAGTLNRYSAREHHRIRSSNRRKWLAAGMSLSLLVGLSYLGWSIDLGTSSQSLPQQMVWNCVAVVESMDRYFADQIDERSKSAIQGHLSHCKSCRDHYQAHAEALGVDFPLAAFVPLLRNGQDFFLLAIHATTIRKTWCSEKFPDWIDRVPNVDRSRQISLSRKFHVGRQQGRKAQR